MPSKTTTLAVRSSSDLVALDEFDQILLGEKDAPSAEVIDDPQEISRSIIAELLAASSDEELEMGGAVGWRELEGIPVVLKGFRWRPSSFEEGGPLYVIVQGYRTDTGEAVVLTTGSLNVLAQLSNMARRAVEAGSTELSDAPWALVKAERPTSNGYRPLHLTKVKTGV